VRERGNNSRIPRFEEREASLRSRLEHTSCLAETAWMPRARKLRLPAVYHWPEMAEQGGLIGAGRASPKGILRGWLATSALHPIRRPRRRANDPDGFGWAESSGLGKNGMLQPRLVPAPYPGSDLVFVGGEGSQDLGLLEGVQGPSSAATSSNSAGEMRRPSGIVPAWRL
jgi:hypothetical protein